MSAELRRVQVYDGEGECVLDVGLFRPDADRLVDFLNGVEVGDVYDDPMPSRDERSTRFAALATQPSPERLREALRASKSGLSRLTLDELRDRAEAAGITFWDDNWTKRDFIEALAASGDQGEERP